MRPWVFRTEDYGEHWVDVTGDLPSVGYAHVVREDPRNPELIYVGTELGIFASWSRGERWVDLRLGLPKVAVRDIYIHPRDNDLIIGTHGRSVFILDDIAPLQELAAAAAADAWFFPPRTATRYEPWAARFRFDLGDGVFVGDNPPYGADLAFYLGPASVTEAVSAAAEGEAEADPDSISVVITGLSGDTVRTLRAERKGGVTRVAWDLREEGVNPPEEAGAYSFSPAPSRVLPGEYRVSLDAGAGVEAPEPRALRVVLDPRIDWNPDLDGQRRALRDLYALGQQGADAVRTLDRLREQLGALDERLGELEDDHPGAGLRPAVDSLSARVESLRESLARRDSDRPGSEAVLARIQGIYGQITRSTNAPTAAQAEWLRVFTSELEVVLEDVAAVTGEDVPRLNERVREAGVPAVGGS
jgi:hypothetical protein